MAASLGRFCKSGLLKPNYGTSFKQVNHISTIKHWSKGRRWTAACLGITAGTVGTILYALDRAVQADDMVAHPPTYPWSFYGWLQSLDHASMRRGWEVYKNVCSACHSLQYVAYRHLINVTHTEAEAKAMAEEIEVKDGPNDNGDYFMRPGKISDYVPSPYPNEEAARAANNGAYPPDLSYIINARHNGENYVFSLLTGYCDTPAGVKLMDGQYFNPYFPDGAIGMAQVLYDDLVDYEDGTPATASQLAKDVVTFLTWTANREHDTRKQWTIKTVGISAALTILFYVITKQKSAVVKTTKVLFVPKKKK